LTHFPQISDESTTLTAVGIRALVARFGSPLLVVDCAQVRRQYHALHAALPGVDLHYALKPVRSNW
jgi:ornithine decarboxylase